MMPTCKALQVWLKRPETDNCGKNQIVMIKPSMPRQGLHVMLFLVILDEFLVSFQGKTKGSHTTALPFTFKSISKQNKTYGNSNILPCKI
jgi:hypothetical protein